MTEIAISHRSVTKPNQALLLLSVECERKKKLIIIILVQMDAHKD